MKLKIVKTFRLNKSETKEKKIRSPTKQAP